jgi:hypothetical protein
MVLMGPLLYQWKDLLKAGLRYEIFLNLSIREKNYKISSTIKTECTAT